MINWFRGLFNRLSGAIADLRDRVLMALTFFWLLLQNLFTIITVVWGTFGARVLYLRDQFLQFGDSIWANLKNIIHVRIPNAISYVLSTAARFAGQLVSDVRNAIMSVVHTLESWAHTAISAVTKLINDVITWAANIFSGIVRTLTHVATVVANLLTDPGALVRWFIGALWKEAYNFLFARREFLARWALSRAVSVSRFAVSVIEELIVRIL
jgi:phage-related protein